MNIKSQKDFFSGVMFMAVGTAFAWGATTYNVGSGARMGPGYFPLMLGVLMAVLGAAITFKSLVVETVGGDKIGAWALRPLFFIIASNLVFGVCLGGLKFGALGIPALGLIVGIFLLVAIGGLADKVNRFQDMVPGFFMAIPATAIALISARYFPSLLTSLGSVVSLAVVGLMLAVSSYFFLNFLLPLIFSRLVGNSKFKIGLFIYASIVFVAYLFRGSMEGSLFLGGSLFKIFLIVGFIVGMPAAMRRIGYKNSNSVALSLLITTLVCMSVWAFIDVLKLQIQLLPTFIAG